MKKILIITLIFLFNTSNSIGGSIDGKNLVCTNLKKKNSIYGKGIYGFKFTQNKVKGDRFILKNDTIMVKEFGLTGPNREYETNVDFIKWWNGYWILNRKTLLLNSRDGFSSYKCNVYKKYTEYKRFIESLRIKFQYNYNKSQKNNKI